MASPAPINMRSRAKAGPSPYVSSQMMGIPSDPDALRRMPADILIVEDNYIIALDLEAMLRDLGAASVRTANSVREAIDLIVATPPEFGLIDVNLGEDKSFDVAEQLAALGIPFIFTTGYGDSYAFPPHLAATPIVTKPYTLEAVRAIFAPLSPFDRS